MKQCLGCGIYTEDTICLDCIKELVRSAYREGFDDGMGNFPEVKTWEASSTKVKLKEIEKRNKK